MNLPFRRVGIIYNDWFLPSKDELNAIYTQLYLYNIGGLEPTNYWSSTEYSINSSYLHNFNNGIANHNLKYDVLKIRPCRWFQSVGKSYNLRDYGPGLGFICNVGGSDYYLEAYPSDIGTSAWSNIDNTEIGVTAQATAIGTGQANTTAIIGQAGHTDSAAKLCNDL